MNFLQNFGIVLLTTGLMEAVAWVSHRYLMHGPAWGWHASHHRQRQGMLEKNDLFAVVFAGIAIALIWFGTRGRWPLQWVGAGMTLYGLLYFVVHDGMVHRRWPAGGTPRRGYLRRLYQAHLLHHACTTKEGAVLFGFLISPTRRQFETAVRSMQKARPR